MNKTKLPNGLRYYRARLGLSQRCLAKNVVLSSSTLSNYERGVVYPSIEVLARLSAILRSPPEQLYKALFQDAARLYGNVVLPTMVGPLSRGPLKKYRNRWYPSTVHDFVCSYVTRLSSPGKTRIFQSQGRQLCCVVCRRHLVVVRFMCSSLEYFECRSFMADFKEARKASWRLINWLVKTCGITEVVFLEKHHSERTRALTLQNNLIKTLKELGTKVRVVQRSELFQAFGVPALTNIYELRQISAGLWPVIDNKRFPKQLRDAAAMGLYVGVVVRPSRKGR